MHSIIHQARNIAWNHGNDDYINHIPFAKRSSSNVKDKSREDPDSEVQMKTDQAPREASTIEMIGVVGGDYAHQTSSNIERTWSTSIPSDLPFATASPLSTPFNEDESSCAASSKISEPHIRFIHESCQDAPKEGHLPRKRSRLITKLHHPDYERSGTDTSDNPCLATMEVSKTKDTYPLISTGPNELRSTEAITIAPDAPVRGTHAQKESERRKRGTEPVSKIERSRLCTDIMPGEDVSITLERHRHNISIVISFLMIVIIHISLLWVQGSAFVTVDAFVSLLQQIRSNYATYHPPWPSFHTATNLFHTYFFVSMRYRDELTLLLLSILFLSISSWPQDIVPLPAALRFTISDSSKTMAKVSESFACMGNTRSLLGFGIAYIIPLAAAAPVNETAATQNGPRSFLLVALTACLFALSGGVGIIARVLGSLLMPVMGVLCVALVIVAKHGDESPPWLVYAVGAGWILVSMTALLVEMNRFEEDQRLFNLWVVFSTIGLMYISSIIRPDEFAVAIPISFTLALIIVAKLLPRPRGPILPSLMNR